MSRFDSEADHFRSMAIPKKTLIMHYTSDWLFFLKLVRQLVAVDKIHEDQSKKKINK